MKIVADRNIPFVQACFLHLGEVVTSYLFPKPNRYKTHPSPLERVKNLREIIKDAAKLYDMTGAKQYNDYKVFSEKLNDWNGEIVING